MEKIESEDIEGLDDNAELSLGDYPIDTVLIRNEPRTVFDVIRRIEKGGYVMDPDFQREFIWPEDKQSKLIESVLMRIPLPVFYLAENSRGQMVVVDGLQRLSTFQRFLNNDLKLKLKNQSELDGKKFSDLHPKLQNRVEDCNLILYLIDSKVPAQALLDIFERVNSGVPLTRQQMRNCLYMGKATRFLKEEANSSLFKKATGDSLTQKTMRDREFVNRYVAFKTLSLNEYKGDMDDFLAKALENINENENISIDKLSNDFRRSLKNNITVFGKHAFRKYSDKNSARSVINASLWDVMSVVLSEIPEQIVESRKKSIEESVLNLFCDENFSQSITLGTSQVNKVKYRFARVRQTIEEAVL
ncbi:DUF262 domain-containing protein [Enterobacter hormaechei]|uniref:DUF262 domain-containing protein n=1 Tax=Enterobacter hormaechei TaxID=158836 RepID=UPI0012AC5D33|nr:DUF262 domain-containing protein [Enterobacter hormaechei]HAV1393421.1 DUF262 domain-containing protein [Enterobacter hormaechei subsp. steigerwaltii]HAV1788057.1 DUF262 domain-containing protein [Enterobacter hormaechei subsp. xiangfangensis]MBF9763653.1 DUF262 domain-containing protein [Enterobacter hormaechei]MBF9767558.1 DUF262 domain-containing protein [Enterobacter hormaechei]MRN75581.1 DUF262 domain-containing protein [Enterobacter hormaechei]